MVEFLRKIMIALAVLTAPAAQAQEKLVAIVFDTSGSMEGRFELPSFGIRLLSATLDGRAGFDRLYSIDFTGFTKNCQSSSPHTPGPSLLSQLNCRSSDLINRFSITNSNSHTDALNILQQSYLPKARSTPYAPLEIMLDAISREVKEGEEVILIVVTDGAYLAYTDDTTEFDGGIYRAQMQRSFELYRQRILDRGGQISAKFLFIDQSGNNEAIVRDQGVRDTLLSVFNGNSGVGAWHVTGREALWGALTDLVAEVSGTDRAAQKDFINYSGNTISVNSPLSISRVVIVSTSAMPNTPPELQSTTFPVQPSLERSLSTQMPNGDSQFGNVRISGEVRHLWFQKAVPAGAYQLTFSGPVQEDEVFLLFETKSVTDLRIFNTDGTEVVADASGQYTLFTEETYTFKSRILDGDTTPIVVDLDTLPANLTMQLVLSGTAINDVQSMVVDRTEDEGTVAFTPSQTGTFQAVSKASAGILSPESAPLNILVLEARTELTVTPITPSEACSTCSGSEIGSAVKNFLGGDISIGTFEVTADSMIDGKIDFAGTILPTGYFIRDPAGNIVDLDAPITFGNTETRSFEIFRPADVDLDDLEEGGADINITVSPAGPWSGEQTQQAARVKLVPSEMGMELINVTQSSTPGQLDGLLVPGGELLRGQFAAQFSLTDLLVAPEQAQIDDLISVDAPGFIAGLVSFEKTLPDASATGFHALDLRPNTSFWCLCFLGVSNAIRGSDIRDYTVRYNLEIDGITLQQASAVLPVQTPIAKTQFSLSCILDAFILLGIVMFLRGIVALVTTYRFPKGSMMEIVEGRSAPRYRRLDKGNSVWWKAWFALFTGNPDEVRSIEGLRIKATARGAIIDVTKTTPPWNVERLGESFAELKESRPKTKQYKLIWGDRMENTLRPTLTMNFKKRSSDA